MVWKQLTLSDKHQNEWDRLLHIHFLLSINKQICTEKVSFLTWLDLACNPLLDKKWCQSFLVLNLVFRIITSLKFNLSVQSFMCVFINFASQKLRSKRNCLFRYKNRKKMKASHFDIGFVYFGGSKTRVFIIKCDSHILDHFEIEILSTSQKDRLVETWHEIFWLKFPMSSEKLVLRLY